MDTRNVVDPNIMKYRRFASIHDQIKWDRYQLLNNGYDYTNNFIENFTSSHLQRNPNVAEFLPYLNNILLLMVQKVKYIQTYFNYAIDKNYDRLNY